MAYDMSEAARDFGNIITQELRAEISRSVDSLTEARATLIEGVCTEVEQSAQRSSARLDANAEEAILRFEKATQAASDTLAHRFSEGARVIAEQGTKYLQVSAAEAETRVNGVIELLRQATDTAHKAAQEATAAATTAATANAEAVKQQEKAKTDTETAEKATALLALAGDTEIERMVVETEFRTREKRILGELKAERAEIEDGYDLKAATIQRGVQQYYPHLAAELERLTSEGDAATEGEE